MTLTVAYTHRLRSPPAAVWSVVGDFGNEHRWNSAVSKCARDTPDARVGTIRTCKLPRPVMGRTEARETLVEYEDGRALAYTLEGDAGPFATAESRWSLREAAGGGTEVTVEGRFTPKNAVASVLVWPLARIAVKRLMRKGLHELDAYVAKPSTSRRSR